MTILVVGDSISFGAELSDLASPNQMAGVFGNDFWDSESQKLLPLLPSKLAWPQLVANAMNQDLDNHSVIGSSNARIHRVTVGQAMSQKYDLVICAWTDLARLDAAWQSKECPIHANNPRWPWVKNYFADHWFFEMELERYYTQILTLQSFFQQRNQSYLFARAIGPGWPATVSQRIIDLKSGLDQSRCIFWEQSMTSYCKQQDMAFGPYGHFLEQGHQAIAGQILEYLENNYK